MSAIVSGSIFLRCRCVSLTGIGLPLGVGLDVLFCNSSRRAQVPLGDARLSLRLAEDDGLLNRPCKRIGVLLVGKQDDGEFALIHRHTHLVLSGVSRAM